RAPLTCLLVFANNVIRAERQKLPPSLTSYHRRSEFTEKVSHSLLKKWRQGFSLSPLSQKSTLIL
ncbi:MAG: hypothetical protein ACOYBL_02325, partial [Lachnospiraceae bacterium]